MIILLFINGEITIILTIHHLLIMLIIKWSWLLPETAAMVDLSINQMSLYEVDRLKTQVTHCPWPRVGQTILSAGFEISRTLKREEEPATKTPQLS